MKRPIGMLLVLMVGCGVETDSSNTTVKSGETEKESVDSGITTRFGIPNAGESQKIEASDTILEEAEVTRDEQGYIISVSLIDSQITDEGLVHIQSLTNLNTLNISLLKSPRKSRINCSISLS